MNVAFPLCAVCAAVRSEHPELLEDLPKRPHDESEDAVLERVQHAQKTHTLLNWVVPARRRERVRVDPADLARAKAIEAQDRAWLKDRQAEAQTRRKALVDEERERRAEIAQRL